MVVDDRPSESREPGRRHADEVASELIGPMPRDVIFAVDFHGESRRRRLEHFRAFMAFELRAPGASEARGPLLRAFVDRHAMHMRDFVCPGVSLQGQLRIQESERMTGDTTAMLRIDLWDQLEDHIETAEGEFRSQGPDLLQRLPGQRGPRSEVDP